MNQNFKSSFRSPALAGAAFMVLAGAAFAIVNISVQSAEMTFGANSASVVLWQYAIAVVCSLPWVIRTGISKLRTENIGLHIIRVVFAAIGVQLWVKGLAYVPIWQAIALIMTSPFFVTLGARLFLAERVGWRRWAATIIGFGGGMIILEPWSDQFQMTALYPLAAAAFWALTSLMTKKLTRTESADTVTLYLLVLLTPINAVLAFSSGHIAPPTGDVLWLVVVAGILTFLAQSLLTWAYAAADAAYLQPFDHLKLPLNVIAGFVVFGWIPDGNLWLGAAMIVGASLAIFQQETQPEAEPVAS